MSQAQPSPKQLNLNSLAMQGDSKLVAVRRRKIRVFEVERVYAQFHYPAPASFHSVLRDKGREAGLEPFAVAVEERLNLIG